MPDKSELLNELYKNIAHELDISRTMRDKAERAYKSVGEYLDEDDLEAQVYTQGSFSLGTVTRPISGEDYDYDIDLVCEMPAMASSSAREIKNVVGDKLKESGVYGPKLEPEGKRCWTLTFDEFHMDVLPCVPEVPDPGDAAIALTHKAGDGLYLRKSSNPRAYQEWFEGRMGESLIVAKRQELGVAYASVDKVPTFAVSTPL